METFSEIPVRGRINGLKGSSKAGRYTLSAAERRILLLLVDHGVGRRGIHQPATIKWIAGELGVDPSSTGVVLRRLGVCGIVVNLGRGRSMDLAVNGDLDNQWGWDMPRLMELRKVRSRQITAGTRKF